MEEDDHPKRGNGQGSSQAWMITFADLTALMLTFFVLLFSMQRVDMATWEAVVDSLKQQLNPAKSGQSVSVGSNFRTYQIFVPRAANLDYLGTLILEKIHDDPVLQRAALTRLRDRLVLSLPSDGLFAPGSADMTHEAEGAAYVLAAVLGNFGNRIDVEGHTDPVPINTPEYPSNWELSVARATAFAFALNQAGLNKNVAAVGLSDSRYGNISQELPEDKRMTLARRVDVVIRDSADGAQSNAP